MIADEGIDNFDEYLESKFSNDTQFPDVMQFVVNRNQSYYDQIDSLRVVSVFITENTDVYEPTQIDTYKKAVLNITYGLYGFMGFCLFLAILGTIHEKAIGADNVRELIFFFFFAQVSFVFNFVEFSIWRFLFLNIFGKVFFILGFGHGILSVM